MAAKNLRIDQLDLDTANPRISKASDQVEAIQRIIDDQDAKLANLAESIAYEGLNPMDRLLVMKSEKTANKFIVLEGNRRAAAVKILRNPAILTGLNVRPMLQKRFEKLALSFDPKEVEPIPCFEIANRTEASTWIEQRHSGENEGRGIVSWSGVAGSRFRGNDPALQALDFVRQYADLTDDQKELLDGRFPITTLDRLLSTPDVRTRIGFDIREDKLFTSLPAEEAIKPLRRIVLDLAEKKVNVTQLKLKPQQIEYISKLGAADSPNLEQQSGPQRAIEGISHAEFPQQKPLISKKTRAKPGTRDTIVPRSCRLAVTTAKLDEIYKELKSLRLAKNAHAISVLLRVFLETSVDHYLLNVPTPPIALTVPVKGQGDKDKSLNKLLRSKLRSICCD